MITTTQLGTLGRLGNQLFQIAATIGIGKKYGHDVTFPAWAYSKYFADPWPTGGRFEAYQIEEPHFHHDESGMSADYSMDIVGYRQAEKYWTDAVPEVRRRFEFAPGFLDQVRKTYAPALSRSTIAISIRRGDFVNNPNYAQIPAMYYVGALLENFPDFETRNVVIFSDDLEYCRLHFECLDNVHFAHGSDIEQLALMSLCDDFIISNSTFSWWGAYLGEKPGTRIIRPPVNFDGNLRRICSERDYWPARWISWDYFGYKLDLRDVTFTIPVFLDHRHRRQNLALNVCMLNRDLDTRILVGEQGGQGARTIGNQGATYLHFGGMKHFHRTRMLNEMAKAAETPFVVNWDADVLIVPLQLWKAVQTLRAGVDMVYPYDGRFARVPRSWFPIIEKTLDLGTFRNTEFKGKNGKPLPTTSVGGAIMFNRESFIRGGMENEKMISFGPEDWERYYRFDALGFRIQRIKGALYHMDHWCGPDSSTRNPFFRKNHDILDHLRAMPKVELPQHVSSWPWLNQK